MPINILNTSWGQSMGHILHTATPHSSSSVAVAVSLWGNAENAASNSHLSQTIRLLIGFGGGIRPSPTIWPNREGDTPIYDDAMTRDNPRGTMVCSTGLAAVSSSAEDWGLLGSCDEWIQTQQSLHNQCSIGCLVGSIKKPIGTIFKILFLDGQKYKIHKI
jgi:hypothetical protein